MISKVCLNKKIGSKLKGLLKVMVGDDPPSASRLLKYPPVGNTEIIEVRKVKKGTKRKKSTAREEKVEDEIEPEIVEVN